MPIVGHLVPRKIVLLTKDERTRLIDGINNIFRLEYIRTGKPLVVVAPEALTNEELQELLWLLIAAFPSS